MLVRTPITTPSQVGRECLAIRLAARLGTFWTGRNMPEIRHWFREFDSYQFDRRDTHHGGLHHALIERLGGLRPEWTQVLRSMSRLSS